MDISFVPTLFGLPKASVLTRLSAGHINQTFLAVCGNGKYVLQSLNGNVFRRPDIVMENISRIEAAFAESSGGNIAVPHFLSCKGRNFAEVNGDIWRICAFIPTAGDSCANSLVTAASFGSFIKIMDGKSLCDVPVIEGFHDFDKCFAALTADNRIDGNQADIFDKLRDTLGQVFDSSLEKRIIHGDAKPDNIIIGDIPTIIDLDTAMYGVAAIDYGDLVRSVSRGAETDLSAIRDVTLGFARGLGGLLSEDEVGSLYYGILWLTGELAMRYLTDSFSEVRYFRDKTAAQCLSRADELMRQLDFFTAHSGEIIEIISYHMRDFVPL